jgi:alpha-NAC-related protein
MFPNLDPRKMQAVMKQMGISQDEIDAFKVIIEKSDNSKIIIENPSVTKVKINGQESFQISGEIREEKISKEDMKTIIQKTGCSEKQAKEALEETGDLAEAIMKLS